MPKAEQLLIICKIIQKTHLALGNLTKLVFWSILSFKNLSFVNCSSLVRENLRGLRENLKHKILKIVQPHETPPSAMRWLHNGDALPTNDDRITLSSAWNPKVTFLV